MHIIASDKKKSYTCPLTQNNLINCNVTSCMWNCSNYSHNCALTDNNISEYDLGEYKGYSLQAVNKEVRKGKSEIKRLLILDKYLNYVKSKQLKFKLKGKKFVKDIFKTSICSNAVYNINYKLFSVCCLANNFEDFKKDNPDIKNFKLGYLLGLRETKIHAIQKSIKVI